MAFQKRLSGTIYRGRSTPVLRCWFPKGGKTPLPANPPFPAEHLNHINARE